MTSDLLKNIEIDGQPQCFLEAVSPQREQHWNNAALSSMVPMPVMRFWEYPIPAVVLGCSQKKPGLDAEAPDNGRLQIVERKAGGGAVLAGPWMLSVSVVLPVGHAFALASPAASYEWLGRAFEKTLQELGINAWAIPTDDARRQRQENGTGLDWACYGNVSPWEVVVGKKKIVGLAQVRRRTGVLFVAGMLVETPEWRLLCEAMNRPIGDARLLAYATSSCAEELGYVPCKFTLAEQLAGMLMHSIDSSA